MTGRTPRGFLVVLGLAAALAIAIGSLSEVRRGLERASFAPGGDDRPAEAPSGHEAPECLPEEIDAVAVGRAARDPAEGGAVSPGTLRAGEAATGRVVSSSARGGSTTGGSLSAAKPKTAEEVWEDHRPKFVALETIYAARLDLLLERAMRDYEKYKGSRARLLALAPRYLKAGLSLEKEADAEFYAALDELAADLRANSLPTDLVSDLKKLADGASDPIMPLEQTLLHRFLRPRAETQQGSGTNPILR